MIGPGEAWERLLCALHARYIREGVAVVERCHPEVKQVGVAPGGRFIGIRPKWGPVDFVGTLRGGRAIVFDAKWTGKRLFPCANIEPHQARDLARHAAAGAVVGIAASTPDGCFWLPWAAIAPALPAGTVDPATVGARFDLAWHPSGKDPVPVGDGWASHV